MGACPRIWRDSSRKSGSGSGFEESEQAELLRTANELVIYSEDRRSVAGLNEPLMQAALRDERCSRTLKDLAFEEEGSDDEDESEVGSSRDTDVDDESPGKPRRSLLDLAVRFGRETLAAELAVCGVKASAPPEMVHFSDGILAKACSTKAAAGTLRAALSAGLASEEAACVLWRPSSQRSLIDVAILAGEPATARELQARGVEPLRDYSWDDFVGHCPNNQRASALNIHLGWTLHEEVVLAAMHAGVPVQDIHAPVGVHKRLRMAGGVFSLLDAAILAGAAGVAAELSRMGAGGVARQRLAQYMLILDQQQEFVRVDGHAVEAALAAGVAVEAMTRDVLQIDFTYPMRKSLKVFGLLDLAVCCGQEDVARKLAASAGARLAVHGSIPSLLTETHMRCREDLYLVIQNTGVEGWLEGKNKALPKRNGSRRVAAGAVAAAELDLARNREILEYLLLFAQWHRLVVVRNGVKVIGHHMVIKHIFSYLLPRIFLTLPKIEELLNRLAQDGVEPISFPPRCTPDAARSVVSSWVHQRAAEEEKERKSEAFF